MNSETEFKTILNAIAEKGLKLINTPTIPTSTLAILHQKLLIFQQDMNNFFKTLSHHPQPFWDLQISYAQKANELVRSQLENWKTLSESEESEVGEWLKSPVFTALDQYHALAAQFTSELTHRLNTLEPRHSLRVQFFTRQVLEALSPKNFLYTNPDLLKETMESQGLNLLKGCNNFLDDLIKNPDVLNISMTDYNAFEIGKNLATTPGKVIYRNDLMELIQYQPKTAKVFSVPLLLIPPWINKYYILDLSPHNSLVRWLVNQGITVFIISWINPDARFAQKELWDYLKEGPLSAIKIIRKQLKVKEINTLGFCIGGTLQAMLLAYLKAKNKTYIKSATFLASMIDFYDPGEISVFIDDEQLNFLDKEMQKSGFLEGRLMSSAFNSLRANDLIWSFFVKNYLKGNSPPPFDILYWNADCTNMPAKMHSQYLRWMYLQNDLIKANALSVNKTHLNVSAIDIPTFFLSTEKDHIAPWKTTYKGYCHLQGDKTFVLGGSGHIAGIIIPPGKEKYGYYANKTNTQDPDKWLKEATHASGSWWPYWLTWLQERSGSPIQAPKISTLPYKAITKAPGTYVHTKPAKALLTYSEFVDTKA